MRFILFLSNPRRISKIDYSDNWLLKEIMNLLTQKIINWLKKFSMLVAIKRRFDSVRYGTDYTIFHSMPLFAPFSSGSYKDRAYLTLQAANQTFPRLVHLLEQVTEAKLTVVKAIDFPQSAIELNAALLLKTHLDLNGSDKANLHNYHLIYGPILNRIKNINSILEIGLGTNNTDVVSNMGEGRRGLPGASVRAFRDFLPNALIYGADIDKRILFEEDRIRTYFVDQTDFQSLLDLSFKIPEKLDMIIDDGLHSPHANIAVVSFALDKLKPEGWLIIEDISEDAIPLWQIVASILSSTYHTNLVAAEGGFVFLAQKMMTVK